MRSIAIESEAGSGGSEIGKRVSAKLGIPYYDGKALLTASEGFHLPLGLLKNYEEEEADDILYCLAMIANQTKLENVSRTEETFLAIQKTIQKLAEQGPAVFDGHCAANILLHNDVRSVFIYAGNLEQRIGCIAKEKGISRKQAGIFLRQEDERKENYYRFWTKGNWRDRNNYDMELNTSRIPMEHCVEFLAGEIMYEKRSNNQDN